MKAVWTVCSMFLLLFSATNMLCAQNLLMSDGHDRGYLSASRSVEIQKSSNRYKENRINDFQEANRLFREAKYDEALPLYKASLADKRNSAVEQMVRALEHRQREEYDKAVVAFAQAAKLSPGWAEAHYGIGRMYTVLNKHSEAVKHYQRAARLKPDYFFAHTNLGRSYLLSKQYQQGIPHFLRARRLRPDDVTNLVNLASAYQESGRNADAEKVYRTVVNAKAMNETDAYNLGVAYSFLGEHVRAAEIFSEAIKRSPDDPDGYYSRSYEYISLKRYKEATDDARKALELSEWKNEDAAYMVLNAYVGYMKTGKTGDASNLLKEASAKLSGNNLARTVLRHLNGEITARQLFARASDRKEATEARYYAGIRAMFSGNKTEALENFRWVRTNGLPGTTEYRWATAELK